MSLNVLHVAVVAPSIPGAMTLGAAASPVSERILELPWNWEPWILTYLGVAVLGYAIGLLRIEANARWRVFGQMRTLSFAAGIATLFCALISPFDALDDQLFSAHMVQHLSLMMVAAPLLVWSRPVIAFLWAFPLPARRTIGRVWSGSGLHGSVHALMSPLVVWVLCSAVLWFWHVPGPYGWALTHEGIHTFEHFCFFVTALMFWSIVLEPFGRRRLDYGSTMVFVATLGVQNGLLGALLTFAGHPFYVAHRATAAAWGLTPLEDQQLAGLIMWIPASLIHLTTLGVLFVAWLRNAEREAQRHAPLRTKGASTPPTVRFAIVFVPLVFALGGCTGERVGSAWTIAGAQATRGPLLMQHYGCGSCHVIPGVANARGQVGPPLAQFGARAYIAGLLRNEPDNLMHWLRAPQSVIPGNAMPDTGVTEQDARDIAAYLYTLQ